MSTTVNFVCSSQTKLSNSRHVYPTTHTVLPVLSITMVTVRHRSWPRFCLKTHQICFPCSILHVGWYQSNLLKSKILGTLLALLSLLPHIQPIEKNPANPALNYFQKANSHHLLCTHPQPIIQVTITSWLDCYGGLLSDLSPFTLSICSLFSNNSQSDSVKIQARSWNCSARNPVSAPNPHRVQSPYNGPPGPAASDPSDLLKWIFPPPSRLRGLCVVPHTSRLIPILGLVLWPPLAGMNVPIYMALSAPSSLWTHVSSTMGPARTISFKIGTDNPTTWSPYIFFYP